MKTFEATEQAYKNGYEQGCKDATAWIPVIDKLPKPLVDVLVYDRTANRVEIGFITRHFEWVGVCMNHEVTHWMPVPQHPTVPEQPTVPEHPTTTEDTYYAKP